MKVIVFAGCAVAAAVVTLAVARVQAAREADLAMRNAVTRLDGINEQVVAWETKVRAMENRARAAERDTAELLGAVNSVRKHAAASTVATGEGASLRTAARRDSTQGGPEAISADPARAQHVAAAASDRETAAVQSRAASGAVLNPEEDLRLTHERAYQQALAKKRAEEAREKASFDHSIHELDPAMKFNQLVGRARMQAAAGEFAHAVRTFNEAMTTKPPELPLAADVLELQATLKAQNQPVDLMLVSDGETFVSIVNTRSPGRFRSTAVKLLPGNYEIVGRRKGFRDVMTFVQVRAGVPLAPMTVACTQPSEAPRP